MLLSEEITIKVSPNVAQAYQKATERKKQSLATLVSLFLREDINEEVDFLGKLMDEISDRAVSRGLTPEIMESSGLMFGFIPQTNLKAITLMEI